MPAKGTKPPKPAMPPASDNMPDISAIRLRTVKALIDGYSSCSVPQLLEPLSPNFEYKVFPTTLRMEPRDRASFALHAAGIFNVFNEFRLNPKTMYEDEKRGVIIVHARMRGKLKTDGTSWNHECVMFVKLNEAGNRVVEIQEFVDSSKAAEMRDRLQPEYFGMPMDDSGMLSEMKELIYIGIAAGLWFGMKRVLRGRRDGRI